ncbi:MAG TPA: hypothetical protein VGM12_05545 [Trebonia sp.]|jgi:hypothetical protein
MGAAQLRVLLHRGGSAVAAAAGAAALTALAAGCGSAEAAGPAAAAVGAPAVGAAGAVVSPTATPAGQATPTVIPTPAPVLGPLKLGTFPATEDGIYALKVCEQWAGLRGDYVARLRQDSPFQLEVWFSSSPQWIAAFNANSPIKADPHYLYISTAFGLVSDAAAASVSNAELLDQACAAAD